MKAKKILVPSIACAMLGVFGLIGPIAAGESGTGAVTPELLASPAPAQSHLSRVTSDDTGTVYLSWVTERDGVAELAFASWDGSAWSDPAIISEGTDWFVNWADFPRLSVHGDGKLAHWLRRSGSSSYDYDVFASFYDPSRQRWRDGTLINTDGIQAEHGFVAMVPTGPHRTLITWLDGRRTKSEPEPGPMTLRGAEYSTAGERLEEWELDSSVCDCCQTAAAMTHRGPIVVYRDRSPGEIRDIAIVRRVDGQWTEPQTVHDDGWQVAGCPVNGPAVVARENTVAVVWFTLRDDLPAVQLAVSWDGGEQFTEPTLIAGADTLGRVDATLLDNGEIVASWLDARGSGARVMLSRYSADAEFIDTVEVAPIQASRRSGFPSIHSVGNTVYVTWTHIGDANRVRVARVRYNSTP